ncbi:unnamed protein product [Periconia digitata]|uniref:1-alkyl-2-acetylglycerophosphocholine esterase n=1 Tax=Periconia digitata TaxID=1303443 RepID=A0A9W4U8W1_9PLEO|nr:unnamed protein product [Periconia digitata]
MRFLLYPDTRTFVFRFSQQPYNLTTSNKILSAISQEFLLDTCSSPKMARFFILTTVFVARCTALGLPFAIPRGTGPYYTSIVNEEWVDTSRLDPFNQTHARRLMISRFDPILPSECERMVQIPYMSNTTAILEDEILGSYEYPKGLRYYHEACDAIPDGNHWPIVISSGGYNTTRFLSNYFAQEIASHGFTVINLDHPYETDIVEFPNGDIIIGGRVERPSNESTASAEFGLEVRAKDASFVLDRLGVKPDEDVVMFGCSFGGAATATAMLGDKRIRAGVNIDGTMFGPVLNRSLGTPERPQAFMLWGSDQHVSLGDVSWDRFWAALRNSPHVDYKKEFTISNTTHLSYWDLSVLVDVAGVRGNLSETASLLVGPPPSTRNWIDIPGRYITAFFSYMLGLELEDDVLKGPNDEFPEVNLIK